MEINELKKYGSRPGFREAELCEMPDGFFYDVSEVNALVAEMQDEIDNYELTLDLAAVERDRLIEVNTVLMEVMEAWESDECDLEKHADRFDAAVAKALKIVKQ